jgi:hypothetical protein
VTTPPDGSAEDETAYVDDVAEATHDAKVTDAIAHVRERWTPLLDRLARA